MNKQFEEKIIGPGEGWSTHLSKGEKISIIDLYGRQAVDFLCFSSYPDFDAYNAANTIKLNKSIYLTEGSLLYTDKAVPLIRIIKDTCGRHDTLAGCCSEEMNLFRYGVNGTKNCRDNFSKELFKNGICDTIIPANINFFMNVPVESDGSTMICQGLSKPGDEVVLELLESAIIVLSNCPQINNHAAGGNPSEISIRIYK